MTSNRKQLYAFFLSLYLSILFAVSKTVVTVCGYLAEFKQPVSETVTRIDLS